jgi:CelD/BcsL family acetyltransferase involved in cellulose biosynthesis
MAVRVAIESVTDLDALERVWRDLETRAPCAPVFQGWTWMGCLAGERFPSPVLLRAESAGTTVGLALFNRRRGGLWLSESGDEALDAPFVEHNAPLIAEAAGPEVLQAMMRAAWYAGRVWHMTLGGVSPDLAAVAGGWAWRRHVSDAPRVELDRVRAAGGCYLSVLSRNARQQIRRSMRTFATRGELRLERATTTEEALAWFDDLMRAHTKTWRRRGRPGAFATPFTRRFHRSLIARGMPRGEVDLLRARAGPEVLGHLYNLRRNGWICAYQSGWDLADAVREARPGIVCHVLAIEEALRSGARRYDFLAGEGRYKRSLATDAVTLVWQRNAWAPRWITAHAASIARPSPPAAQG